MAVASWCGLMDSVRQLWTLLNRIRRKTRSYQQEIFVIWGREILAQMWEKFWWCIVDLIVRTRWSLKTGKFDLWPSSHSIFRNTLASFHARFTLISDTHIIIAEYLSRISRAAMIFGSWWIPVRSINSLRASEITPMDGRRAFQDVKTTSEAFLLSPRSRKSAFVLSMTCGIRRMIISRFLQSLTIYWLAAGEKKRQPTWSFAGFVDIPFPEPHCRCQVDMHNVLTNSNVLALQIHLWSI